MVKAPAKPLPFVVPKSSGITVPKQRLPERKRMTLVTGISGFGGIVLCADSQETIGQYAKKSVEKIRIITPWGIDKGHFAIAGAGNAPYLDMITAVFEHEVSALKSFSPEIIDDLIKRVIGEFYRSHIWPRGASADAVQMELLIVAQDAASDPHLWHTSETAVNWMGNEHFKSIGVGAYLADYLLSQYHTPHGDKYHMLAMAVYVLRKVRDNIDGCGKEPNLIFFPRGGGAVVFLWEEEIAAIELLLGRFDKAIKDVFYAVTGVADERSLPSDLPNVQNAFVSLHGEMAKIVQDIENKKAELQTWRKAAGGSLQ